MSARAGLTRPDTRRQLFLFCMPSAVRRPPSARSSGILSRLRSRSGGSRYLATKKAAEVAVPMPALSAAPLGQLSPFWSLTHSVSQWARQRGKGQVDHPRMCGPFVCSRHTRAKSGLSKARAPSSSSSVAYLLTCFPFPASQSSQLVGRARAPHSTVLSPIWHIGFIVESRALPPRMTRCVIPPSRLSVCLSVCLSVTH